MWKGHSLLCPDRELMKTLMLKNEQGSKLTKHITFRIERCQNTTESQKCHSNPDINKYIENIQVEAWIIDNKIDLEMYDKPPWHRIMDI